MYYQEVQETDILDETGYQRVSEFDEYEYYEEEIDYGNEQERANLLDELKEQGVDIIGESMAFTNQTPSNLEKLQSYISEELFGKSRGFTTKTFEITEDKSISDKTVGERDR